MKKIVSFLLIFLFHSYYTQSDCSTSIALCGGSNINFTPSGYGNEQEDLGGCLTTDEHYSVWYNFTVSTAGTLTFTIVPNASADYDWALYGPNLTCATKGEPIRCSYAALRNSTGLRLNVPDVSEDGSEDNLGNPADGFVRHIDVQPGETYILVVDNYSQNTNGFQLTWGGTATIASPFNDPNIAPNPFLLPGQNGDENVFLCSTTQAFDFSSLTPRIINGNPNYTVAYYRTANDAATETNAITSPIVPTLNTEYHYVIRYTDPIDPNNAVSKCREYKTLKFQDGSYNLIDQEIKVCKPYNSNVSIFDLTSVSNYTGTQTMSIKYYPTVTDAQNGTNEILTPQNYNSAEGTVYVKYTNQYDCVKIAKIHLGFLEPIQTMTPTLTSCFIAEKPTMGIFDLTTAVVDSGTLAVTKKYYLSLNDALNDTNPIDTPTDYESASKTVYVRITDTNKQCWTITSIKLKITSPTYSSVLMDQMICLEDRAVLDAGSDFDAYVWSTGATTQSISDVKVGEYWVDLLKNGCTTRQIVKVQAAPSPIIKKVEVTNNTITVSVEGGHEPYEYSTDGQNWQGSNILTGVKRGEVKIYVRDRFLCSPIITTVTVPNLINAITPNGDGHNDTIDYSELRYKKNLTFKVFDRQGTLLYEATKANFYIWNGNSVNRKLPTDNYWYVMTWTEDNGTLMHFTGWVLVKNH